AKGERQGRWNGHGRRAVARRKPDAVRRGPHRGPGQGSAGRGRRQGGAGRPVARPVEGRSRPQRGGGGQGEAGRHDPQGRGGRRQDPRGRPPAGAALRADSDEVTDKPPPRGRGYFPRTNTHQGDAMRKLWFLAVLLVVGLAGVAVYSAAADKGDKKVETRYFEMRT